MPDATVVNRLVKQLLLTSPQGSSETTLENALKQPEYIDFLTTHLASMQLAELQQLPSDHQQRRQELQSKMAHLCTAEYKSFLSAEHVAETLSATLCGTGETSPAATMVTNVSTSMQQLESAMSNYHALAISTASSGGLDNHRAQVATMLRHHDKLLDILDNPSLLTTLVQQGFYDQALDLHTHCHRLSRRYATPLIARMTSSVDKVIKETMVSQLVATLKQSPALHSSLRIIGYLRRMRVFSEAALRVVFLTARLEQWREQWILKSEAIKVQSAMESLNSTTSVRGSIVQAHTESALILKSVMDLARTTMIDIITQYQAIFTEESVHIYSDEVRAVFEGHLEIKPTSTTSILSSFIFHLVHAEIIPVICTQVQNITDMGTLASLLTQAMHFGVALSRKGADTRALLAPIFTDRVRTYICQLFNDSTDMFLLHLKEDGLQVVAQVTAARHDSLSNNSYTPPTVLSTIPLLAQLTNDYLTAFNALRLLPVLDVGPAIGDHLCFMIEKVLNAIPASVDKSTKEIICKTWVPYILDCFYKGLYNDALKGCMAASDQTRKTASEILTRHLDEEPIN